MIKKTILFVSKIIFAFCKIVPECSTFIFKVQREVLTNKQYHSGTRTEHPGWDYKWTKIEGQWHVMRKLENNQVSYN